MEEQYKLMIQMLLEQNAHQAIQIRELTAKVDELLKEREEKNHKKNSRNSSAPSIQ